MTTNNQLLEFFIYVISGILISIFFDVFRALRKSFKTSNLITYIEDLIFWIIVGLFLIWEIFTVSYGELRSYIFIALLLGIIIYLFAFSKYFLKISVKVLEVLKSIIRKVIAITSKLENIIRSLLKPILILIKKPICFLFINFKKTFNKNKDKLNLNLKNFINTKKKKIRKLD